MPSPNMHTGLLQGNIQCQVYGITRVDGTNTNKTARGILFVYFTAPAREFSSVRSVGGEFTRVFICSECRGNLINYCYI